MPRAISNILKFNAEIKKKQSNQDVAYFSYFHVQFQVKNLLSFAFSIA